MLKSLYPFLSCLLMAISCSESTKSTTAPTDTLGEEEVRLEILATLNGETAAAFQRDYEKWQTYWVHSPSLTKSYINFADSSMSESVGWEEISAFVREYMEAHPDPVPLPAPLTEIELRLYGTGAWVTYEQIDPSIGRKREARLLEKLDGQWKIAGMQTTIYAGE